MQDIERIDEIRVYKYPLKLEDRTAVLMPANARILCVQAQREQPCLWARINTCAAMEKRWFYVVGTGHQMPVRAGDHVGTFQLQGGALVFHVFEER